MKKLKIEFFTFLLFFFIHIISSNAQQGWAPRNPLPQYSVNALYFLNINTGFGVCDKGLVIKTINGGDTWLFFRSYTGRNLYSLYFFDNSSGYIVGDSGTILYTSNAGSNWTSRNSNGSESLRSITFVNTYTGFIAGENGKLLKTVDGGLNWTVQSVGSYQLNCVYFLNSNTGFITGSDGLFAKTINAGTNWTSSIIDTFTMRGIWFTDINTGYATGCNGTYKTIDGGLSWSNTMTYEFNRDLYSVCFLNAQTGYCIGRDAPIYKTTNAGLNWMMDVTGIYQPYTYFNIFIIDTMKFISGTDGYILKSSPNAEWRTVGGTKHSVNSLAIINSNILGCADNQTLLSTNGGINWAIDTYGANNFFEPISQHFKLLRFSSLNNLYRVTYVGGGGTGGYNEGVSRSTNGGLSWNGIDGLGFLFNYINDISAVENSVYAVRSVMGSNHISKSVAGTAWTTLLSDNTTSFSKISFYDMNTGIVVGIDNNNSTHFILRTINGGASWTRYNISSNIWGKIQMLSPDIAVIMTYYGAIYRTTNGGADWFVQDSVTAGNINDFYFTNFNTGWIAGSGGMILYTTSSGYSWDEQISHTDNNLFCVSFMDELNGVVGGDSGIVLKTTNGGITYVAIGDPIIPRKYMLGQNYPNPFNPKSKIKFHIAKLGEVKLVIFDVLGREITTLVNERLSPGIYEAVWNGSNFASGLYFYKLITDEFVQTKKMVLLK